jgi:ribosomal protein L5
MGLKEHSIFPELLDTNAAHSGMDITFVTSSNDNKACKELLNSMGMPFAGRN